MITRLPIVIIVVNNQEQFFLASVKRRGFISIDNPFEAISERDMNWTVEEIIANCIVKEH